MLLFLRHRYVFINVNFCEILNSKYEEDKKMCRMLQKLLTITVMVYHCNL